MARAPEGIPDLGIEFIGIVFLCLQRKSSSIFGINEIFEI
jgi:hypothetical protein